MVVNVNILTFLAFSFVPLALVVTAETQDCMQVLSDRCTTPYKQSEDAASNKQEICTALAVYLRCVQGVKKTVKSCISDISYHTISTLIPRQMENKNCGNVSLPTNETLSSSKVPAATTPATNRPVINQPACLNFKSEQIIPSTEQITQNPHHSRLCALFGDPHLKTFMNDRQTCVVEGAWPLIENEYFSVQVTNVPLVAGSSATATNTVRAITLFWISTHLYTERVQTTQAFELCIHVLQFRACLQFKYGLQLLVKSTACVRGSCLSISQAACVFPNESGDVKRANTPSIIRAVF